MMMMVMMADKYPSYEESPSVELLYPSGDRERFILAQPKDRHEHTPLEDLLTTMTLLASEYKSAFPSSFLDDLEKPIVRKDHHRLRALVNTFNDQIRGLREAGRFGGEPLPCSMQMSSHIWGQAYERTIENPRVLNQYKGFSKEVYGETNPILINDIITKHLVLRPGDVFIDLGSGIGNVVFQVAAQTQCTSYGIELKDNPSRLAGVIQREAEARCRYYHKGVGNIFQRQGDFLGDESTSKILARANVVFVNNFAFEAETNQGLLLQFLNLREGARIICFKEFSAATNRITAYNHNDVGGIFKTERIEFWANDGVSWTSKHIHFFVHVVDRTGVKEFEKESTEDSQRKTKKPDSRDSSPHGAKRAKVN